MEEMKSAKTLSVPEQLKNTLKRYVSFGNGTVSETSDSRQWTVSDSDLTYSGYHDESTYYISKAIVSDREISLNPVLKQCTISADDTRRIQELLQGFEILEITRFFSEDPSWPWTITDCRYVRLRVNEQTTPPMKDLWIVLEETKTR